MMTARTKIDVHAGSLTMEIGDEKVIKDHKRAIGWTLADIPGISHSFCMHRILLEEDAKPVRQPQRRLNPQLMEVVKKQVTKLL